VKTFPNAKFFMMGGDQVDTGYLEEQWLDYFGKPQDVLLNLAQMATVGNHEGPYNDNFYHHYFYPENVIDKELPQGSVYAFEYGDALFMSLNTMDMGWDDNQKESFNQQLEWMRRVVAESDKKWKFVLFHKGIYSVGIHALDKDILELRQQLYPVIDELGIDAVLQGHDHTYMRSFQMYGNKAIKDVKVDATGRVLNPNGTVYMTSNASGTKFYDIKSNLNAFYAAKMEQKKIPVYSGISMEKDSFTIRSFRSGEKNAFDSYSIVRTDTKPEPVQQLKAGRAGDGNVVLSWKSPENEKKDNEVRGYRIYEKDGKLGRNWSAYVPAGKTASMQFLVPNSKNSGTYQFVVKSVNKRLNSDASEVTMSGDAPAAPIEPKVNNGFKTFGWTPVIGYTALNQYEFTVDGGKSWSPVMANPQQLEDADYAASDVGVRVKADKQTNRLAGAILFADQPYTRSNIHETYKLQGELVRKNGLAVTVEVVKQMQYSGDAYLVIQLLKGNEVELINTVPITKDRMKISQFYPADGKDYEVKIFVLDSFTSKLTPPQYLASPVILH